MSQERLAAMSPVRVTAWLLSDRGNTGTLRVGALKGSSVLAVGAETLNPAVPEAPASFDLNYMSKN